MLFLRCFVGVSPLLFCCCLSSVGLSLSDSTLTFFSDEKELLSVLHRVVIASLRGESAEEVEGEKLEQLFGGVRELAVSKRK